jgi:hypothetical protein
MAHIFVDIREPGNERTVGEGAEQNQMPEKPGWAVAILADNAYSLGGSETETLRPDRLGPESDRAEATSPLLMNSRDVDGVECWIVVDKAGSGLRVNGVRVTTGARVLRNRDEMRLAGVPGRAWFSDECKTEVTAFDGPEGSTCPRCKVEIKSASMSVRCPLCRVYYHQSAEYPCWTYAVTCAFDPQPTDLEANFRWTPGEFERNE